MSKITDNLDTMYKRPIASVISEPKYSVLLLGPRQTGKSTLMHSLRPDLEINLANEKVFLEFSASPAHLEDVLRASSPRTVFIDEVQRLPSLLNTIQSIIDESPKRYKFYLTGSSARKLKRGQANLLPGRLLTYHLHPMNLLEIDGAVDIRELLSYGTLPGILNEPDSKYKRALLNGYAATYLKEEIQAEALTKNIEGFSRFIFVAAAKNGEFVDYSKLGSQAAITQKTATRFFEILEDTMIMQRLPPFAGSDLRRLVQHPKFYFFDVGVLNGLLNNFVPSLDRIGRLFETFAFNQFVATLSSTGIEARFFTYRTTDVEVDFIIETQNRTWAVEIKASTNIGASDLKGLKSFLSLKKKAVPLVVYLGERRLERDGIAILPLKDALEKVIR